METDSVTIETDSVTMETDSEPQGRDSARYSLELYLQIEITPSFKYLIVTGAIIHETFPV